VVAGHSYLHARWLHDRPSDPIEFWSELDTQRFETRKLEIFMDGHIQYADAEGASGETELGQAPLPSIEEINKQPVFEAEEISKEKFETVWRAARGLQI